MYKIYGDEYLNNCHRLDYSAYGGESAQSMLDRTAEFLRDLENDKVSEKIAVVTHGGTIHGFLSNIIEMPMNIPKLKIENCSVTKLSFSDGEWSVAYINQTVKRTERDAD
jgi:alpha-ribazole phosphatase/probable phosphoglycerate mutase